MIMTYYIENLETDPYHNLALEQVVFDKLNRKNAYFLLWQNHNSIIVGKHQNTQEEINAAFVKEQGITVARRLSGGGAVYHDLGNLNYTFITDAGDGGGIDFAAFCAPIREALLSFGVPVEIAGRNDMIIEGKKFSGNAQYLKEGRVMHHGTILYDSDLSVLSRALKPGDDKIESKGIKSVQSRVTNVRPYMKSDMPIGDFWAALSRHISAAFGMAALTLTQEQNSAVEALREKVYSQWDWNYGRSPPHTLRKTRRVEGCGKIEVLLNIGHEGKISGATFYGDFFGNLDPEGLVELLKGHRLEREELEKALADVDISGYFHNLNNEKFIEIIVS